ncbi:hypothetical protein AMK22_26190 [Streptomyces sp. CB01580]|nr:hypothetical protein AMK22_26190 [Streptomyces sp. CB01580]
MDVRCGVRVVWRPDRQAAGLVRGLVYGRSGGQVVRRQVARRAGGQVLAAEGVSLATAGMTQSSLEDRSDESRRPADRDES